MTTIFDQLSETDNTFVNSLSPSMLELGAKLEFLIPRDKYEVSLRNDTDAPLWDVHVKGANFDVSVPSIASGDAVNLFPQLAVFMPDNYEITGRYFGRTFDLHTSVQEQDAKEVAEMGKPWVNADNPVLFCAKWL